MKRGMNKKAEGGTPSGSIIPWVIGLVVVAIIFILFFSFFGTLGRGVNIYSKQLALIADNCNTLASSPGAGSITGYCNEFKPIDVGGKTEYTNCEYAINSLSAVVPDSINMKDKCDNAAGGLVEKAGINVCKGLKDNEKINGKQCCNFVKLANSDNTMCSVIDSWGCSKEHLTETKCST